MAGPEDLSFAELPVALAASDMPAGGLLCHVVERVGRYRAAVVGMLRGVSVGVLAGTPMARHGAQAEPGGVPVDDQAAERWVRQGVSRLGYERVCQLAALQAGDVHAMGGAR